MKCPYCTGRGIVVTGYGDIFKCRICHGTGNVEPLTNEQWFCGLSTEEKAKFLKEISFCCNTCFPEQFEAYKNGKFKCPLKMACATANGFEDWLKEKHE